MSVLGGVAVLDNAETSVLSGLFPAIRQSLGLSLSALGVLAAVVRIAAVIFGPFWVWVARRTSRKGVLVVAGGLWSVWGIAAGFAQTFTQLLVLYAILAIGCAAADPIIDDIIGDLFDERTRGRAVGLMYACLAAGASIITPAIAQLTRIPDGWRIGMWILSGIGVASGIVLLFLFTEPGRGATQRRESGGLGAAGHAGNDTLGGSTWDAVKAVLKIPSFLVMLGSRLLSGHLIVLSFGVVFLVDVHGFTPAVAATALLPLGIGYVCGAISGGVIGDWLHARDRNYGRIRFLQFAQVLFAVVAFGATQFDWGSILLFGVFYAAMGFAQGLNPGLNRPIVMSVVPSQFRGVAFAIFVSVFEGIIWALYQLSAGYLGEIFGLKSVFLVVLVGIMLANAAWLTLLYRTYPKDAARAARATAIRGLGS